MEKFKAFLKRCFVLPLPLSIILAAIGYGLVLAVAVLGIENTAMQYASYFASAYALIISVTGFPRLLAAVKAGREKFRGTSFGGRFSDDVTFRAGVFLYQGFLMNLLYVAMKLITGILYRSAWLVWLAIYYALLAAMRFLLIRGLRGQDEAAALQRYRLCGFMLLFMNQALAALVVFIVHENRGFHYPGMLIYAMAAYAFYSVIMSVVSIVRTQRLNNPILSAAKAVSLVTAMVSMLALETAMLSQFGGDDTSSFRQIMTGALGGAVCTIVIAMAVYMIWNANKKLKKPVSKI